MNTLQPYQRDALGLPPAPKFSYSYDQEHFEGEFDSREDALAEAIGEQSDRDVVFTGINQYWEPNTSELAESLVERIVSTNDDSVYDLCGGEVDFVMPTAEQRELYALLKNVLDGFYRANPPQKVWTVNNIQHHLVTT